MAGSPPRIAVVGGGPAGLFAAETAARSGASVSVFDASRAVAKKLLVAGYGGLNLTHGEPLDSFVTRYRGPDLPPWFADMIRAFPPAALRDWAAGLGVETFEQRTGRVYPKLMKAAPLVRAWLARLRELGVVFHPRHALTGIAEGPRLAFNDGELRTFDAVILALGGASWTRTGSTGQWRSVLEQAGINVSAFQPANCGWEAGWPDELIPRIEGLPLKNITATANGRTVRGELMLTRYGLEGGAIYQLGPDLRAMDEPTIVIDLKPESTVDTLVRKMESVPRDYLAAAPERWKLNPHTCALLEFHGPYPDARALAETVKALAIPLSGPRPIDEAISSAGGIAWSELDEHLMLRQLPGVFAAGEMIDWEAPTGGYLIQACFASGKHAAEGAMSFLTRRR